MFEQLLPLILAHEGVTPKNPTGFVNIPGDSGGDTAWGISTPELLALRVKPGYSDLPASVKDLTLEQVTRIYKNEYYLPAQCDLLPTSIALVVFDAAVNEGVGTAVRILQSAIGAGVDGNFGPVSVQALKNALYANTDLLNDVLWERVKAYDAISKESQTNQRFLAKLWLPRMIQCRQEALALGGK